MNESRTVNGITYYLNKPYIYMYNNGNSSKCVITLVKFLDDMRCGVARFLKVINDDSGNGYFTYLYKTGNTMNISLQYLHELTEKDSDGTDQD